MTTPWVPNRVSILIPHYNQPFHLSRTLKKCLSQSYPDIEIVVVDDATPEVVFHQIQRRNRDPRIKWVRFAHRKGPAHARNIALKECTGEFIQYLDADDSLHPEKLKIQVQALRATQAPMVTAHWRFIFYWLGMAIPFPIIKTPSDTGELLLGIATDNHWFPVMCCLFTRDFLEEVGPWHETDFVEDREFRWRVAIQAKSIAHVNRCLFNYYRFPYATRSEEASFGANAQAAAKESDSYYIAQLKMGIETLRGDKRVSQICLRQLEAIDMIVSPPFYPDKSQTRNLFLIKRFLRSLYRNWKSYILGKLHLGPYYQMKGVDI